MIRGVRNRRAEMECHHPEKKQTYTLQQQSQTRLKTELPFLNKLAYATQITIGQSL